MTLTDNLDSIADKIRSDLLVKDAAREKALPLCREAIRYCSKAIRALHRQEFDNAGDILSSARKLVYDAKQSLAEYYELQHSRFLLDAQKEFAEGSITLALITRQKLPDPDELGVDYAAYLNGLGEAVGEVRRYILDSLRKGDQSRSDELLQAMDDIYDVLVTMDFPDAITASLRHTTDMVRAVLERTRSDLTLAIQQKGLENKLESFKRKGNKS
ncbi:MAG: haloacid dehalogenase [Dehalococcoidales bacterium]|nr:haloacid dehalogenase [Dehalococcoidales bacterium]